MNNMKAELIQLERANICGSCGRKIKRGIDAISASDERSFFCNLECMGRSLGVDYDDEDDYD